MDSEPDSAEDVAVGIDGGERPRLNGETMNFLEFLMSGPTFDDIEFERPRDLPRVVDFLDDV